MILFTAIGFPAGGNIRQSCTKIRNRQLSKKGETNTQNNKKTQNLHNGEQTYNTRTRT